MHLKLNHFSDAHCRREHSGTIERKGDDVLVIHDISTNPLLKALSWMMAGSILVIAVLSAITTQNVLAIIMLIVILLSSVALSAGGLTMAIDFADRTIRRTWKVRAFCVAQGLFP
jgi:hypothetical protein